jgi:translocation and assembly module TamB
LKAAGAPRRLLGGLVSVLAALGLSAVFGVGAAAALVAHLDLASSRRAAARVLEQTLDGVFQGQVSLGALTRVGLFGVEARDIVVRDRAHRVVLKVTRLSAEGDVLDILKRALRGDQELSIVVGHVRVERAEAELIPDEQGLPTLVEALTPRPATEPAGAATRKVRVALPAIEIGHAFARGSVSGSPTLEAELTNVRGSVLAASEGAVIDVTRFALLARGVGGGDARGVASFHLRAPGAVWGTFDGYMGDVQFGSAVRWEQEALDLKVEVPRAEPLAARALLAEWPLLVASQARLRLSGRPPNLEVGLTARLGEGSTLSSSGMLYTDGPRLQLDMEGRRLDLRALWPTAPATSLDVDAELGIRREQGRVVVDIGGSTLPTSIAGFAVPAVELSGSTSSGSFVGEARVLDLGLPLDVDFTVLQSGRLELSAQARRVDLSQVVRLKPYAALRGMADAKLSAAIDQGQLDAQLSLELAGLRYEGATLQRARVIGSVKGPLDALERLQLAARLSGERLDAGRFSFNSVSAAAFGGVTSPTVTASLAGAGGGPSFDGRARVTLGDALALRGLSLGIARDNVEIRGDVAQLDLADDRVLVRDLRLHGATGELSGSAELSPKGLSVSARGHNLDLSAVSRVMGLPRGTLEGRASLVIDAVSSDKTQQGTLQLSVDDAALANLNGISAELSASLSGRQLSGSATGRVDALGAFSAEWDTMLAGPPTRLPSYEAATGTATLSLSDVTLDYVGQLLPEAGLDFGGLASGTLTLSRDAPDAVPSVQLSAQTKGLQLSAPAESGAPTFITGVELLASATHDGATGQTAISLGAERGGERLASASADIALDLPASLSGRDPLGSQLERRPVLGKLVVNRLDLQTLPEALRLPHLRGSLRLEGTLRGSLAEPTVSLAVSGGGLRFAPGDRGEPIDVCGTAEYEKASGAFNVGAELFLPVGLALEPSPCAGRRVVTARFTGRAPFDTERGLRWSGTALATLEQLPLETIPLLGDARVSGTASGTLQLDRSGEQPSALAQLRVQQLKVDRALLGDGELSLRSSGPRARATFEVTQSDARVSGSLDAGVSWASDLPALDDNQPIDASVNAARMQASLLEPLLTEVVSELRGRVDGDVRVRLAALKPGATAREVEQVTGEVGLQGASMILTGLGFRLRDVAFRATATRDGKTTLVDVPDLIGSAGGSSQNLRAKLRFRLLGFDIVSGTSTLTINRLPLVVDGVTRANANAEAELILIRKPEKMLVDVIFTYLDATLPEEETRQLTELNDNPSITLLQPIAQPKGRREEDDLPWHFVVHLGNRARLGRGSALDLKVSGDPNVVLARDLGVTGSIFLTRGGALVLYRKLFTIESGGVHFDTPDPKDPRLDVQASYRSPDGETLFVYVTGTLAKPTVNFDRSRDAAMAVLLKDDASATNLGIGVLDSLLGDTPLGRVQLRSQESGDTGEGTIYSAQYRVSDKVVVEGNYRAATKSASDDDSADYGAAVDWRVGKNVSVRGQLGTIGTGVELVYQYEY